MRALTWHGKRDVRVETVPDPAIQEPTDAIIKVTSSGLCVQKTTDGCCKVVFKP